MNNQLSLLRELMQRQSVAATIIPGTDPHHSEYTCPHWQLRQWLTGFTGSNGTAVVTLQEARLWTDSRYFLQAEQQLEGSDFTLVREGFDEEPTITQWLAQALSEDDVLAIDGTLFTAREANMYEQFCGENGFMLATDFHPAERIWKDLPQRPLAHTFVHDEQLAGETVQSKLSRTVDEITLTGADAMLITALDDIAWLFNIRGNDVQFTPVVIAFAWVSNTEQILFIDNEKLTDEVRAHLNKYNVHIKHYDDIERFLERRSSHETVLIDPDSVSDSLANALPGAKVYSRSPITNLKAVKNNVQIDGFRHAHERDGAALVRLFRSLELSLAAGDKINEIDVWNRGKDERAKSELYRGDSFAMIAGYREHGAIVHYSATPESAATLEPDGLLLVDSGAQYLDGTTDITRTITLGNPTHEQQRDYTFVLKGHLALARAQFPVGTCGVQLDALARMPLWTNGLSFLHGTGHGVGHFLGCHEGPHSIRTNLNPTPLLAGMVTSNEPGIYRAGKHGIRIENLLLCVPGDSSPEFGEFLRFETLTLFPYDTKLILTDMLTREEIEQINNYHATVLARLSPLLSNEETQWLTTKCATI